jgi:chromosome segregation ATPase
VEEQLHQERSARQQAESQLQQERSALEDARAALEEAQGQLQRERTTLGEARATLQLQDSEIAQLTGELVQEAVSFEELRNAGEKKHAIILELQQTAETMRDNLETEKK